MIPRRTTDEDGNKGWVVKRWDWNICRVVAVVAPDWYRVDREYDISPALVGRE